MQPWVEAASHTLKEDLFRRLKEMRQLNNSLNPLSGGNKFGPGCDFKSMGNITQRRFLPDLTHWNLRPVL
jgi:hypothetical protein